MNEYDAAAKTGYERMRRLLALVQSILAMAVEGKRDSEEVCDVLQVIKDDKDFATILGRKTMSEFMIGRFVAAWKQFYYEEFGISLEYIPRNMIPDHQNGWDRLIVVAQGLTPEKIYQAMKKRMPAWKYWDNLDGIESIRKADKTYAIWVRDRQEADEELKNKSANDLKRDGTNCVTLEEHLLMEMMYFRETDKHLDIQNITLCAGSRDADGGVPGVDWGGSGVDVGWCFPGSADAFLRSRSAVS